MWRPKNVESGTALEKRSSGKHVFNLQKKSLASGTKVLHQTIVVENRVHLLDVFTGTVTACDSLSGYENRCRGGSFIQCTMLKKNATELHQFKPSLATSMDS